MICPDCKDPKHVEILRVFLNGRHIGWCTVCDVFFFCYFYICYKSGKRISYNYGRLSESAARACQDPTD